MTEHGFRRPAGCLLALALALAAGCGPTAYRIEPIPADRSLEESTLIDEGGWSPAKLVLIDVSGVIMNGHRFSLLGEGENPVSLFVEKLDKAAGDPSVRGVLLRINSPGGSVTASDVMYRELLHFRQRTGGKRPVVAVMMDVAASGGYYLACAADEIIAHPTSVTGSIGVIMLQVSLAGTLEKIGVSTDAIKSGPMKDAGSPFRRMSGEERALFQHLIDEYYERFVEVVKAGRPRLDEAAIRKLADGRVYSGRQALERGLVDRVGTLRDGLAAVKQRIGARAVRVVTYHRPLDY
ncbi:MAG: signal peptide peptidase SppA, partial [Phycisphaerae bacterium]